MELLQQITALLEAKFQGARKDVIQTLAGVIALQVEDEKGAKDIVDRMTADGLDKFGKAYRGRIDSEIQTSNTTLEQNLRKKYDFKEKGGGEGDGNQGGGSVTLDQIKQLMQETMNPMVQRLDAIEQQKVITTRRESFQEFLKGEKISESAVEMLMGNFDRMTFKDQAEYDSYTASLKPMLQKMAQDYSDEGLRRDGVPGFANKNQDGVSQAVADYIQTGKETGAGLGGKAI